MTEHLLPGQFQDLALFLEWALATERERSAKRQSSTMGEIKAFYQAMLPRHEGGLSDFYVQVPRLDVRAGWLAPTHYG